MKKLSRSIIAVVLAGLSAPIPKPAAVVVVEQRSIDAPRPAENQKATPIRASNSDNLVRALGLGGVDFITRPPCIWPHNRPQPGWRKVQSRRRHKERMRRQRRNA